MENLNNLGYNFVRSLQKKIVKLKQQNAELIRINDDLRVQLTNYKKGEAN